MRIRTDLPAGVTALLFEEAARRRALEQRLVGRLEAAGFGEILLPVLDYWEPYKDLLADRVRQASYRFVDRDGQLLGLRSDFTAMIARLLAPRLCNFELPIEVFYRGDVIRHELPRPGRLREYYEVGAELVGRESPQGPEGEASDDERMLRLFLELLVASGDGAQVVLGVAGALDGLLAVPPSGSSSADLAGALARRDRAAVKRAHPVLLEVLEQGAPNDLEALGDSAPRVERLIGLAHRLGEDFSGGGLRLSVDLAEYASNTLDSALGIVDRRYTYYDGIVFRAYPGDSAVPFGQGGRYDSLFSSLAPMESGVTPAIGFSLGVDRLLASGRRR